MKTLVIAYSSMAATRKNMDTESYDGNRGLSYSALRENFIRAKSKLLAINCFTIEPKAHWLADLRDRTELRDGRIHLLGTLGCVVFPEDLQ